MDVTVSVAGRDAAVEELRSLFTWLAGEEEFRGRVRLVETAPEPGTLGGWPEAVVVALGEGGAVTVLASAVIAWIRHRTSEVTCTVTRPDGTSVELTATRVRSTDLAEVGELVEQVAAALGEGDTEGKS
jgi:Effector Associated Constant Component 1